MSAFTETRGITLTVDVTAGQPSPDAYVALINKIQGIEDQYAKDSTSVADLAGVNTVFTGKSRYKLYSMTITSTMATGIYAVIFSK